MNFFLHLHNAWRSLKRVPLLLVIGAMLVSLLGFVSFGLLIGPLHGAYMEIMIRLQRDGHRPTPRDFIAGFSRFGQLFPLCLLMAAIILGFMIYMIPGILIATMWIYTLPLMADRRISLTTAMNKSAAMVQGKGFFNHLIFLLMITMVPLVLLNTLVSSNPYLQPLFLLLLPLQHGCLASLYLQNFPPDGDLEIPGEKDLVRHHITEIRKN